MVLQSICKEVTHDHIRVMTYNTTAVAYVRNTGGSHSLPCNDITRQIWEWCLTRNIWVSISHIPMEINVTADQASRVFDDSTEWKLNVDVFNRIVTPTIDMFASRLNHQLTHFVSWLPDPQVMAIDAFTLDWTNHFLRAFPSLSILPQFLQKLEMDQASSPSHLDCPNWPTHSWYPKLIRLLIRKSLLLPRHASNVHLPFNPEQGHLLGGQLRLMACFSSRNPSRVEEFHKQPTTQSSTRGGQQPKNNTWSTLRSGSHLPIIRRAVDPLHPPVKDLLEFLQELYDRGLGYSCPNTASSALSSLIVLDENVPVENHPLVLRFLKGVFQTRPAFPRYTSTLYTSIILTLYLKTLHPPKEISLRTLTHKLVMLCALVTGQLSQTLHFKNLGQV